MASDAMSPKSARKSDSRMRANPGSQALGFAAGLVAAVSSGIKSARAPLGLIIVGH
jgi:hypothetical protein